MTCAQQSVRQCAKLEKARREERTRCVEAKNLHDETPIRSGVLQA